MHARVSERLPAFVLVFVIVLVFVLVLAFVFVFVVVFAFVFRVRLRFFVCMFLRVLVRMLEIVGLRPSTFEQDDTPVGAA